MSTRSNFPKTENQEQFVAAERQKPPMLRRDLLREKVRRQILEDRRRLSTKVCNCIDYIPFKSCYAQDFACEFHTTVAAPSDDLYQTDNAITYWSPHPTKLRSIKRRNDFTKPNAEDFNTQFR